ncbi:hypothetical protein [Paenibacillus montanisoli]|uniref:Uncharacterized protein n=1 Tax=Paenibacillus montanisoli TaxID=2081970 RepID=A0A328U6S8_9BACL|nr:hypothetical protein [Paenibacillus montanisoli]RAP78260.1 hypothetical protein DL346_07480 [Paenibacillus montanisoli]
MQETNSSYFEQLKGLKSEAEIEAFGKEIKSEGFTALRHFLDDFRQYLRAFVDDACVEAAELLHRAQLAVPEPGRTSPSWTYIWREYKGIIRTKQHVFGSIPPEQREGEWQVLLDNPFSNQNIAVYPGLTFIEAAYMFAYFRTELMNNEYIRLQKIATVMTCQGVDEDGLQPIASL